MTENQTPKAGYDATVQLSDEDALFGLELHRSPDGWTATMTGRHLPPEELAVVYRHDKAWS